MNDTFYLREFGKIKKGEINSQQNIDEVTLNKVNWDFLANYANSKLKDDRFIEIENLTTLEVKNFVGVITTPNGVQIEILPKTDKDKNAGEITANKSREILAKMLKVVHNLPFIQTTQADLQLKNQPLLELLISWFLSSVGEVVKKSIRKDYIKVQNQEKFLKGSLQIHKQLNEPLYNQHKFHIKYNTFSINRVENNLIYTGLLQVLKWSRDNENQRLIKHYLMLFDGCDVANNYTQGFKKWNKNRDMNYYQSVLPWLKLILNQQSPFTLKDNNSGISFLIPMEKLFEKYVFKILQKQLSEKYILTEQKPQKFLARWENNGVFTMKPDIVIRERNSKKILYILDTKWKLINQDNPIPKYGQNNQDTIKQADIYQLFAYGKKYSVKKLVLIYPKWDNFNEDFSFNLDDDLCLNIKPFNLENNNLVI
jgi:5-methylcytosine-specific restriction enzyme subunit McrC